MSRRYGRKQKRAAQEMILDLACTNRMLQGRVNDTLAEWNKSRAKVEFLLDRIDLWDREIRGLLGPYTSFAINDVTYRVKSPDQIRQMALMPGPLNLALGPEVMPEAVEYHIVELLHLMAGFHEDDLVQLRKLFTLRVESGPGRRADQTFYAVSREAWAALKRAGPEHMHRMIQRIAGDLVRYVMAPPPKPSGDDLVPGMERDARRRDAERLRR